MKRLTSLFLVVVLLLSMFPTAAFAVETGTIISGTTDYPNTHPNTWVNTGDQQRDIVEIAKTQIGYQEVGSNNLTKYNYWYYGSDTSVSWCGTFISWCAAQAEIPNTIIKKNALAGGYSTANMQQNPYGCPAYAFGATEPQLGDIIFVAPSGSGTSEHVGLIIEIDDEYIYTAEGNVSDSCGRREYSRKTGAQKYTGSHIVFYARPKYEDHSSHDDPDPPTPDDPDEPAAPCEHRFEDTTVAATCTTDGYTLSTCTLCSYSTKTVTPATGHSYYEIRTNVSSDNYASYVCSKCRNVARLESGHQWNTAYVAPTCYEGGMIRYSCSCGSEYYENTNDVASHQWGAWSVTTPGSATEYAVMTRTCKACSETETDEFLADTPFTDIAYYDYFYLPTFWATNHQITAGTSETTFSPLNICTRAQVVTFLYRQAGCPEPTSTVNPFTDVFPEDYYYNAVLWAVENGITYGIDETTFFPHWPCTRGQVVTFLYRAAGNPEIEGQANPFLDVPNEYYRTPILWAVSEGITMGMSEDTFVPTGYCQRGQVVTFLYRYSDADSPIRD